MTTNYNQQAANFLRATNTSFSVEYLKNDFYFPDDKDTRDIYEITLKNSTNRFRFTFGQSISNSGLKTQYVNRGTGIERQVQHRIEPTAYDVLSCLQKYDPGTFENFCADFGYDPDSRKAYKIYKAVMKEWKNIELLFTPEQLEQLQEIS